jgi:hypothetical protein
MGTVGTLRPGQLATAGIVFHLLNRCGGRRPLFAKEADYLAFERVIDETLHVQENRGRSYCSNPHVSGLLRELTCYLSAQSIRTSRRPWFRGDTGGAVVEQEAGTVPKRCDQVSNYRG